MIIDPTPITEMTDMDVCRGLRKDTRPLLEGLRDPSSGWIASHKWAVMPQAEFRCWAQYEWIATAARRLGYNECVAVSNHSPLKCYSVPMMPEGISEVDSYPEFEGYILVPRDLGFAIYLGGDDFVIIAGPRSFVRRAVGCSFDTARKEFEEHYRTAGGSLFFPALHELYLDCDGKPEEDDNVSIEPVSEPGAVTPIEDCAETRDFFDKARPLVSGAGHFSRKHIRDNNWTVVPRRQPVGLRVAEWIAETVIEYGHKALFGVPSSDTVKEIVAYRIPMNRDSILEFAEMRANKCSVVFPTDLSFAILIADEWYFLVGGPEDFVRKAFNQPISDAREDFEDDYELHSDYFLDDYESTREWPQAHVRRRMHAIAERYKVFDRE